MITLIIESKYNQPRSLKFVFDYRGLTITETKVTDKAIYECIASNLAGDESKVITLIIESEYNQSPD